jgi:hypothetical protein
MSNYAMVRISQGELYERIMLVAFNELLVLAWYREAGTFVKTHDQAADLFWDEFTRG